LVYTSEYGQFGGKPYGAIIGNFDFAYGNQDMVLLKDLASVATMSHAPFIAAAGPEMFGVDNFDKFSKLKDLKSEFEGSKYAKFRSFRDSEDARYVGLCMPRFLLRLPYGAKTVPAKSFKYEEDVSTDHQHYLWGNAAFAFASRLTDSFAKYRWCANITGPMGGGAIEDLPLHEYEAMGATQNKIPTEILIPDRRDFELAEEGFIPMCMRKDSDNAAFFSANSTQMAQKFGETPEGKDAEANFKLGLKLPYLFVISRLAHYIKVIQRENIGTWKGRNELQNELQKWIRQYISDMDNPQAGIIGKRPLRRAEIKVLDVEGDPGWYKVDMKIQPHFKYEGASFTLSLVGKLDKE
jgi:type VI secretion system protein ImpC